MLRQLASVLLLASTSAWGQIHVSAAGDDANEGTSAKPVATVARAVELTRAFAREQPKTIVLQKGEFFDTGILLTAADSGLVLEARPPNMATLIGGVRLSEWGKDTDRFWSAALPASRSWDVRMLQVNGRFCKRARYPEEGTLTHLNVFNVPWMSTTGGGWKRPPTSEELTTLRYKAGDLPADLDIHNAEVTVFHMWDESVAGVSEHDSANQIMRLSPSLGHPPGAFGVQTYCVWNTKEGMTHPGQWYFDRGRQRIVYWPLKDENMAHAVVIVPTQRSIIRLVGATNVTLRNFDLAVTTVPLVTGGFAAAAFDGAIQLDRAARTVISGLHIANVAGQAIKGSHEELSVEVLDCAISGCGAGGVYLSGANNVVSNTLIHSIGRMFPSAMAINGEGRNCKLSHNEIFDTTYSAIGFSGRDLVIENNLISDCMKVLHDGAAIYCFGAKHSILRNNFAHDIVDTGGYGASAFYLDEQSEDTTVENNVAVNVARPAHNHMATNNTLRGNVFVSQHDMHVTFPRCTGYRIEGNVLYAEGNLVFEGINNVASWSSNLVFAGAGKVEGTTLKDYSSITNGSGVCGDTLVGDPRFRDVEHLNLHYAPQSPALKLGLVPVDVSVAGRLTKN